MRLLVFGIHPDDIELSCGGSVALAARQGHEVILADLSTGEASSNGTPEERAKEAMEASKILGATQRVNLGFHDTKIQCEDPQQLHAVVSCVRRFKPDFVFIPHKEDPHPDHASGGELIERSLYFAGVQGYQTGADAWAVKQGLIYIGRLEIDPDFIVDITSTFEVRVRAIKAHRTQFIGGEGRKPTPINSPEFLPFIEARSRCYGFRIGARYGEPFLTLKPMALSDFNLFMG
ncbi:MAG: bacillithiol biosynthesis deacetylase BshB1 [Candidatus Latescibacteria bacterium]|nr:bacillithiol biosynthesis deacetylase BshB1 [Candidatus Latescibacterota bacterium]NIM20933.1 bacillithiol biosynthesis deacetylase BshB1 [Candidatus Latescibacterota bacterium]NIM65068.1 bacillithiol biosynthesis deacetylase BshB1 [Candidatus Latescibacterota bacterium]NIO01583.1 bacillithiol biosynthesis deacetylase BshB1 [Candidatus Latescibacterota bacterium]NIO28100.1 bacillithiol biosynthesis deacetylase BshB1 [Candidatus Latescibacterota bacterium]